MVSVNAITLLPSSDVSLTGKRLLTIPQVAERLSVSTRKTWRLIAQGQLKTVRVGARSTRIPDDEVDAFIEKLPDQASH